MKFKLEIECNNEAFLPSIAEEVQNVCDRLCADLCDLPNTNTLQLALDDGWPGESHAVKDTYGNTVGKWEITA